MNLRVQSETTSILVRQLTCLLDMRKEDNDGELGQRVGTKMTCEDKGLIHDGKDKVVAEPENSNKQAQEGSCFVQSDGLWMMRAH